MRGGGGVPPPTVYGHCKTSVGDPHGRDVLEWGGGGVLAGIPSSVGSPMIPAEYFEAQRREENCFAGGGDGTEAHLPNPPPSPSLVAVPGGGFGLGLPFLPCAGGGGGGSDPNIHGSK